LNVDIPIVVLGGGGGRVESTVIGTDVGTGVGVGAGAGADAGCGSAPPVLGTVVEGERGTVVEGVPVVPSPPSPEGAGAAATAIVTVVPAGCSVNGSGSIA
jgi:hypothetical protein